MTTKAFSEGDPILEVISPLVTRLAEMTSAPDVRLTFSTLVAEIGANSHVLLLLVLGLLNLLPGPPGYSSFIGVLIAGLALAMVTDREIRLWPMLGERRVPTRLVGGLTGLLDKTAGVVARISEPRLEYLCGRTALPIIGLFILVEGLVMLCPIPFTNTLPSWSVVALCIAILNHDGLALIAGIILGLIGLVVMIVATWAALSLATMVVEVLE